MTLGRPWPIWFMVWWVMWQWMAQSPGFSAVISTSRVAPTGTRTLVSGTCALGGMGPPSVPVTRQL
jgi:hypothetical protein